MMKRIEMQIFKKLFLNSLLHATINGSHFLFLEYRQGLVGSRTQVRGCIRRRERSLQLFLKELFSRSESVKLRVDRDVAIVI